MCVLALRRALALLLVVRFGEVWAGLVVHMPLEARPSEGLKETGGAFCFITVSSASAIGMCASSLPRAKGLVQRGPG